MDAEIHRLLVSLRAVPLSHDSLILITNIVVPLLHVFLWFRHSSLIRVASLVNLGRPRRAWTSQIIADVALKPH